MSGRLRACSIVTRVRPPAGAGAPYLSWRPPFPGSAVGVSGLADGHRRRVLAVGVQGPVIRVIGQYDAIGAQLVDQPGRISGAGYLRFPAAPPGWVSRRTRG